MEGGHGGPQHAVKTFVFLDLEATGLGGYGRQPRITELSMVATSTLSLLDCQLARRPPYSLPRVLDKLTFCVYPMKQIEKEASEITGLYNDNLYEQKDFDEGTARMVVLFLQRLIPPVCLLAHNGKQYDFGLLKTEMARSALTLPPSLLCVDTLELFRCLDGIPVEIKFCSIRNEVASSSSGSQADNKTTQKGETAHVPNSKIPDSGKPLSAQLKAVTDIPSNLGQTEESTVVTSSTVIFSPGLSPQMVNNITPEGKVATASEVPPKLQFKRKLDDTELDDTSACSESSARRKLFSTETDTPDKEQKASNAPSQPESEGTISYSFDGKSVTDLWTELDGDDVIGDNDLATLARQLSQETKTATASNGIGQFQADPSTSQDVDRSSNVTPDSSTCKQLQQVTSSGDGAEETAGQQQSGTGMSNTIYRKESAAILGPVHTQAVTMSHVPPSGSKLVWTPPRLSYKLADLHQRIMGQRPGASHRAEDDCVALLHMCQARAKDVIHWANQHAVPLANVPPLYSPRSPAKVLPAGVFPSLK